ncbi:MAG: hypothetical protein HW394_1780, partial [Acidobacteria bacterium]|nr:hypothetical protein [Acidobacteriota bacterium]
MTRMPTASIQVDYNRDLHALAETLAVVKRPGDFCTFGSLEAPMPRLDIEGVGTVSFPIPATQARQIIRRAVLAPYGRGQDTIVDTRVRKVWQLAPNEVRLSGKHWADTLSTIVTRVSEGLGAHKNAVTAQLYKLLVYDKGGFFVSHRDTEKTAGMFATLVVVLPSAHRGGEVVIRHAGREAVVDLSTQEVSQLTYAAFYADCEHEVRPIHEGRRVCLVYNLIQRARGTRRRAALTAPDYTREVAAAAKILSGWAQGGAPPPKLVYVLEHQYSPAGLSWAGLKNGDAARGKTLAHAARQAGCAVHLGVVHIQEEGIAELLYDPHYDPYYDRRSRWRRGDGDGEDESDDEGEGEDSGQDFDIVEVSESIQYIDDWKAFDDRPVEFGRIPLGKAELLPEGALDNEKPDEARVMEATGNEGASFERAYHRAAIIVWPESRYADVLLQAGVGAALPYLRERIAACSKQRTPAGRTRGKEELVALAERMVETWHDAIATRQGWMTQDATLRMRMLRALRQVGGRAVVRRFIEGVVLREYDGSENAALLACGPVLGAPAASELLARIVGARLPHVPRACVDLLKRVVAAHGRGASSAWRAVAESVARAAVAALPGIRADANDATFSADAEFSADTDFYSDADVPTDANWHTNRETRSLDAAGDTHLQVRGLRRLASLRRRCRHPGGAVPHTKGAPPARPRDHRTS